MSPVVIRNNQVPNRFYRGGSQIAAFRSSSPSGEYEPEDWVASTTCCYGHDSLGLTVLECGRTLKEEIQNQPEHWLGPAHVKAFGSSTKLLVKLLDAGQRLPIHGHPRSDWAQRFLGSTYGKAELWFVLEPGTVWLGLQKDISREHMRALVDTQKVGELLEMMHKVRLERGQAMYVPPGVLHAIGQGMLIVEVQEPSDLSVLCEWRDFEIDGVMAGHLGLGFDVALTALELSSRTRPNIEALVTGADTQGLVGGVEAREYFRAERYLIKAQVSFDAGFAIMIILGGELEVKTASGSSTSLHRGMTIVIPYGDGGFDLGGD